MSRLVRTVFLAALLAFTLGGGVAPAAIGGGHAGGFGGAGRPGGAPPGHAFGNGRFSGPGFHHGRGDHRVFVYPYYADPFAYEPYYPYDPYCDPYSVYYAPQYCYWDGE